MLMCRRLLADNIARRFNEDHISLSTCYRTLNFIQGNSISMESKAVTIRSGGDDELKITFFYNGQRKEFSRKKFDAVGKTLQRIALKLQPQGKKKKKKGEKREEHSSGDFVCRVLSNENELSEELSNEASFQQGHVLRINTIQYFISVNPPTVTHLSLPAYIMAGFPIIPKVQFEGADIKNSTFKWLKSPSNDVSSEWSVLGEESTFIPSIDDIDFYLKCICSPGNGDVMGPFSEGTVSEDTMKAGPGLCLFDERHIYTPSFYTIGSSDFRVITYNVLANMLADTDYARTELFPFCPPYAIKADYRRQLLFKELVGYHGDIICLQECTVHEYENYLEHWMSLHGYNGFLKLKLGEMTEGEALFYRDERYEHVADFSTSIEDALFCESNKPLLQSISSLPTLMESLLTKKNIGQIHLLKEKQNEGRCLCILNTHLFYKRHASHIRLLQISILLNHLKGVLNAYEKDIPVIVAGDFNALQGEPLLSYLSGIQITEDHGIWNGCRYEDVNFHIDLRCPLRLNSLSGFPEFTSYVPHCKATLDYIFGDDRFITKKGFIPIPKASDIDIYTGVPCVVYPSDHFAVVLDLTWTGKEEAQ